MADPAFPNPPRFTASAWPRAKMVSAFEQYGFLIIEDFLPLDLCSALQKRAQDLIDSLSGADPLIAFAAETSAHAQERYFLDSANKISLFYEDAALREGRLLRPAQESVNKIGHALHDRDPLFSQVSRDLRLANLCADLNIRQPLLLQSMYLCKASKIGAAVDWHQDATFLHTDPVSVTGFWFALAAADEENGGLEVIPGGHKGPLQRRFLKHEGVWQTVSLAPPTLATPNFPPQRLTVGAGALVVLHGLLPHRSGANRTTRPRPAYALHVIDGQASYGPENWLQRDANFPLRGF